MSLTLGEKLRQAREERGFTISEVSEQTRISSLYLESIEHDDYKTLPGGIFNKGFVKSYAKFVGVDEHEALLEYSNLVANTEEGKEHELKLYKPKVMTDDRSGGSMVPTVIVASIILALMTGGILFLVNYLRRPTDVPPLATSPKANSNANASEDSAGSTGVTPVSTDVPPMSSLKVEFKALTERVSLSATTDGKMSSNIVTPGTTVSFEPRESLKLSYSRSLANTVQLIINGKQIALPAQPLPPKRNSIEFEITKDNLAQIWNDGAISKDVPPAVTEANANTAVPPANGVASPAATVPQTPPTQRPTPVQKANTAANSAANAAVKASPEAKPSGTPKQPAMTAKPAANGQPQ
jgi:cytoskeletal protein RodZ